LFVCSGRWLSGGPPPRGNTQDVDLRIGNQRQIYDGETMREQLSAKPTPPRQALSPPAPTTPPRESPQAPTPGQTALKTLVETIPEWFSAKPTELRQALSPPAPTTPPRQSVSPPAPTLGQTALKTLVDALQSCTSKPEDTPKAALERQSSPADTNNAAKPNEHLTKFAPNAMLELRCIPAGMNNVAKLKEYFTKFGTVVNVKVWVALLLACF